MTGLKNVDKVRNFLLFFLGRGRGRGGGGGGGCFSGSSIVATLRGQLKVSSLKLNDFVLTYTQGLGFNYTEVNFLEILLSTDMNN